MSDLLLSLIRRVVVACDERHGYMPTTEEAARQFKPHQWVRDVADQWATQAYAEGRKDEAEQRAWQPIESCPEDTNVLVATQGGWVDTAFWTDEDGEGRKWWWLETANKYVPHPIHSELMPTHWMALPKHPGEQA